MPSPNIRADIDNASDNVASEDERERVVTPVLEELAAIPEQKHHIIYSFYVLIKRHHLGYVEIEMVPICMRVLKLFMGLQIRKKPGRSIISRNI